MFGMFQFSVSAVLMGDQIVPSLANAGPSGKFLSPSDTKSLEFDSVLIFYYNKVFWAYYIYFLLRTSLF